MADQQELYSLLDEYTSFYIKLADEEKQKLEALLSNKLEAVERAVGKQQAASMQIERFEARREELQEQLGWAGKTFREVIAEAPAADQQRLQSLYEKMKQATEQVKYFNEQSLQLVKTNLELINGELPPSERAQQGGYTPKGLVNDGGSSIFHSKA